MWPNFFLAGAPKAGTTSLFEFLRQHPQIFLSPIKEPTFFARADLRPWDMPERARAFLEKDRRKLQRYLADPRGETHWHLVLEEEDYLRLFSRVRGERAIGEASVSYFWRPSAAAAIAARVPHAKLVFVLRHPVDRLFSHYLASLRSTPGTSFRDCFRSAKNPTSPLFSWLEGGLYATNLQRFFSAFPREQIRVYLYDDYRNDPRPAPSYTTERLGVPARVGEAEAPEPAPAVAAPRRRWSEEEAGYRNIPRNRNQSTAQGRPIRQTDSRPAQILLAARECCVHQNATPPGSRPLRRLAASGPAQWRPAKGMPPTESHPTRVLS